MALWISPWPRVQCAKYLSQVVQGPCLDHFLLKQPTNSGLLGVLTSEMYVVTGPCTLAMMLCTWKTQRVCNGQADCCSVLILRASFSEILQWLWILQGKLVQLPNPWDLVWPLLQWAKSSPQSIYLDIRILAGQDVAAPQTPANNAISKLRTGLPSTSYTQFLFHPKSKPYWTLCPREVAPNSAGGGRGLPLMDRRNSSNTNLSKPTLPAGKTSPVLIPSKGRSGGSPRLAQSILGKTDPRGGVPSSLPSVSVMDQYQSQRRSIDQADKSRSPSSRNSPSRRNVELEGPTSRRGSSARRPSVSAATPSMSVSKVTVDAQIDPQASPPSLGRRASVSQHKLFQYETVSTPHNRPFHCCPPARTFPVKKADLGSSHGRNEHFQRL